MNVRDLITAATARLKRVGIPDARLEAESLLAHALGRDKAWILARTETSITEMDGRSFLKSVGKRARREPFAYVVGEKWFYGRRFVVNKHVLIPRPETELLVEAVLASLSSRAERSAAEGSISVLDVGTGSGAIGLTLAAELPNARAVLYDISKKALDVARANTRILKLGRRVRFKKIDILKNRSLDFARDDKNSLLVLAANLPYLPLAAWKRAMPEVRLREPKTALVSGKDGLAHYRALFAKLTRWKQPPDVLALEAEPGQFGELGRLALGLMPDADVEILKDLHGDDRVLVASKRKRP